MNWQAVAALVKKDLQVWQSDRRAMLMGFVVPLMLGAMMGYVTGGNSKGSQTKSKISVEILNLDNSASSQSLIRHLSEDESLDVKVQTSYDAAAANVRGGKVPVAIIIPAEFSKDVSGSLFGSKKTKPELKVLMDPSHSAEAALVRGLLMKHAMESLSSSLFTANEPQLLETSLESLRNALTSYTDDRVAKDPQAGAFRTMLKGVEGYQEQLLANHEVLAASGKKEGGGFSIPFEINEEEMTGNKEKKYNAYAHTFGGMGIQFVLMASVDAAILTLNEKKSGVWKRLRSAPLSKATLLTSRLISSTLISFAILTLLFLVAKQFFGADVSGSGWGLLLAQGTFSLMAASVGIMIAALARTPGTARGVSLMVILTAVLLGGVWVPSFLFPAFIQKMTLAMPTRWAMDAFDGMTWRGLGLNYALTCSGMLLGFTALFGLIGYLRFNWEEET